MTQGERTKNIKAMLKHLATKKRMTVAELRFHVKTEVTEMGATDRTIKGYIEDCGNAGLIKDEGAFLSITPIGKDWLRAHI